MSPQANCFLTGPTTWKRACWNVDGEYYFLCSAASLSEFSCKLSLLSFFVKVLLLDVPSVLATVLLPELFYVLHMSTLSTLHPMYQFLNVLMCSVVIGCAHMAEFIAGHTITGFSRKSHARITNVTKLSHNPFASLPSELASSGAMRTKSAHLRSAMCITTSSMACHVFHSYSSVMMLWNGMPVFDGWARLRKWKAELVAPIRMVQCYMASWSNNNPVLTAAILPVINKSKLTDGCVSADFDLFATEDYICKFVINLIKFIYIKLMQIE